MQGLPFVDRVYGQGGWVAPHEHKEMNHCRIWCIDYNGTKLHVESHDIFGNIFSSSHRKEVSVKPCDGSCQQLKDIPEDVWKLASSEIK